MGRKLVWAESYTSITGYSVDLTDEQAELYETDRDKFFDEVFYELDRNVEWDKIKNEETWDMKLEGSEDSEEN
jgi:hypothetical protein